MNRCLVVLELDSTEHWRGSVYRREHICAYRRKNNTYREVEEVDTKDYEVEERYGTYTVYGKYTSSLVEELDTDGGHIDTKRNDEQVAAVEWNLWRLSPML